MLSLTSNVVVYIRDNIRKGPYSEAEDMLLVMGEEVEVTYFRILSH